MRRSLAYLGVAILSGFALSFGCLATGPKIAPTTAPASSGQRGDHAGSCGEGCAKIPGIDLDSIVYVLDDPRLAEVRRAVDGSAYEEAATLLGSALDSEAPDEADRSRWEYQLGRIHLLAGNGIAAAEAFDRACARAWPLVSYARFAAAQAYARAGRGAEALSRLAEVEGETPLRTAARLLEAEILSAQGEKERAIAIWEGELENGRRPVGWPLISLQLAEALLEVGGPRATEEAAILARRVIIEAPATSSATRAASVQKRALARIPEARRFPPLKVAKLGEVGGNLSPVEHVERASSLSNAGRREDALKTVEALLATPQARLDTEAACRGELLRAQLYARKRAHSKASSVFAAAIDRCERFPDALADALFGGGKAAASSNQCEEAMRRYQRVERELPSHSYADDARLRGALCALELGDAEQHAQMLATIADDYPDGDMSSDGLFKLALHYMVERNWREALSLLDRSIAIFPDDRRYWAAGRAQYFRAKALDQLGQKDLAEREWGAILRDYPLSYYMLKAYARLAEREPKLAEQLLEAAIADAPEGPFELADLPIFHEGGFQRTIELIRAGEVESARREVQAMDLVSGDYPPDALWAVSLIYARTGSARLAHMLPRGVLKDWLEHYPVGKWRAAWELAYPRPWSDLVEREADRHGIPTSLAYAVMRDESAFDENAVSPAKAYGLMQLIVPTAKSVGKKIGLSPDATSLKDPEVNIALGCRFLADLRARFANNPALAIPSYNAGPGAPLRWMASRKVDDFDLWVEQIPFLETRKYTQRVLTSYAAYLFLYERDKVAQVFALPASVE